MERAREFRGYVNFRGAISDVQGRLSRNRKISALFFLLSSIGLVALSSVLLTAWSVIAAAGAALAVICVAALAAWRSDIFSRVSRYDAALFLDKTFTTSERAVSYVEIEESAGCADPRAEILLGQLEERIPEFSAAQLLPLRFSRRQKAFFSFGIICGLATILLVFLRNPAPAETPGAADARMIEDLLRAEAQIPPELYRKLEELASDLRKEEAGSEKLKNSLGAAQQELARTSAGQQTDVSSQEMKPPSGQKEPAPAPSQQAPPAIPTPTPTAAGLKDADKTRQQEQGGQGQQSRESSEGKDEQGQQGKSSDGQKQEGTGSGEKKESQQQEGQGGQASKQSREGKQGQDGQARDGQQAGQTQDQQRSEALKKTEQALNQVEENLKQQAQGNGQEKKDSESGEKGQSGQQGQDNPQKQDKQGQGAAQRPQSAGQERSPQGKAQEQRGESKGTDRKEDKPASDGESSQNARDTAEHKTFQENKTAKSSLASPQEQEKRRGQSPLGDQESDGLGGNKGYRDVELNPQGEKYDTSQTGQDAGASGDKVENRPRTSLADVELARPETIKEKVSQPVPLEYRDLLR